MTTTIEMQEPILYGMLTRYSTWTARVTILLEYFQIPHTVEWHNPFAPGSVTPAFLKGYLYPTLQPDPNDKGFLVGDSLAVSEYLAETYPELGLWPRDSKLRALARTSAAQMHSGFENLRGAFPGSFVAKYTGKIPISEAAAKDLRKLVELWSKARAQSKQRLAEIGETDDGFLYGRFSIADAFFWPVLWRIRSYQLPLDGISGDGLAWMARMWSDPAIKAEGKRYFQQAADPKTALERYDDIFNGNPDIQYSHFEEDWEFTT